jgi:hypothetical protein
MKDFMSGRRGCKYFISEHSGFLDEAFGDKEKGTRAFYV